MSILMFRTQSVMSSAYVRVKKREREKERERKRIRRENERQLRNRYNFSCQTFNLNGEQTILDLTIHFPFKCKFYLISRLFCDPH